MGDPAACVRPARREAEPEPATRRGRRAAPRVPSRPLTSAAPSSAPSTARRSRARVAWFSSSLARRERPRVGVGGARRVERELPGLSRGVERDGVGANPERRLEAERRVAIAFFLERPTRLLVRDSFPAAALVPAPLAPEPGSRRPATQFAKSRSTGGILARRLCPSQLRKLESAPSSSSEREPSRSCFRRPAAGRGASVRTLVPAERPRSAAVRRDPARYAGEVLHARHMRRALTTSESD